MKNDTMFRISARTPEEAGKVIHRFLSIKSLTNPECTIFGAFGSNSDVSPIMETYDGGDLPSLTKLQNLLKSDKTEGVLCVAATDENDTRRVTLSYMPYMDFVVMSFPMANNGLNDAEENLLRVFL